MRMTTSKALQLIDPRPYSFAENLTIDLHDLATIVLRERLFTEPRFKHSQLYEICNGDAIASCLPADAQVLWTSLSGSKVGYFLKEPLLEGANDVPAIEPQTFLHPDFQGASRLTDTELETAFWRVKHHDSGFILAHALQLVLDTLPESTMLRVRTSEGHSIECKARSNAVAEMIILPKVASYICNIRPRPDLGPCRADIDQHYSGDDPSGMPWLYLVFGDSGDATGDVRTDGRAAVDLVTLMLGMCGLGGEVFAMERIGTYHHHVLAQAAEESEEYVLSGRILMADKEKAKASVDIARRVLTRLQKIVRDEATYCAYCGKEDAKPKCTGCLGMTNFCGPVCQKKGWKYHKVWCKTDAAFCLKQITIPEQ